MSRPTPLVIGLALAVLAAPALAAPCAGDIEALSKRVQEEGRQAISASTSGKSVAAAREGQGAAGAGPEPSVREAPAAPAAQAGEGAEKVQAAKVALDEARTLDRKGDAKGCSEAVARASKALGEAP